MKIHLYSLRNAFLDGSTKLHPGFTVDDKHFVISRTRPFLTEYVEVTGLLEGPHLKPSTVSFLTITYNKNPKRFNNNPAGTLRLTEDIIAFIRSYASEFNPSEYSFH